MFLLIFVSFFFVWLIVKEDQKIESLEIAPLDFISTLPETIIHYIFSFLRARDVTSTSVLSKTWHRIWSCYPIVVFHFAYGNVAVEQLQSPDSLGPTMQKDEYLGLMEKSVCRRLEQDFPVQRFQLYTDFPDIKLLSAKMDEWVSMIAQRNAAELALSIDSVTDSVRYYYKVPEYVFIARSLTILSLSGCRFEGSLNIKLPYLKKLSLSHSFFVDKFTFNNILSGCSVIEYVKVSSCRGMDSLIFISGFSHLKTFEFLYSDEVDSIRVDVSNLLTFSFASHLGRWPSSIDLTTSKALKELILSGKNFAVDFAVQPLVSQLPALEVLELRNWTGSRESMISSQSLKKLVFRYCHHLKDIQLDTPNLESFEYCNCDEPFIPINVSNAIQIHLRFALRGDTVNWLVKLQQFLSRLSYTEDLNIIIFRRSANMIIHEKFSEFSFSTLCHFMDPNYICISSRSYTDLLDELFPLAYPKSICVIHSNEKLMKLLSEKVEKLRNDPRLSPKLVGFHSVEVGTSGDTSPLFDAATQVLIKTHSTGLFRPSAIMVEWGQFVRRGVVTF
ncbi:OLC1v1014237C1 [Oldenlandia corymbosa var. corymbosa]|uniref:OLC1v1014237C1 n=1 Tax=Oldenlandia corymbosa var. corymbosa TaxID=529605 RepID=A0AAV1E074_OLDCO|nr:OLC1v1014237C1 [Oldenlandia corymbosa var. corymbosa]